MMTASCAGPQHGRHFAITATTTPQTATSRPLTFPWHPLGPGWNGRMHGEALPGLMTLSVRRQIRVKLDNQPVFISTPRTGGSRDGAAPSDPSGGRSPKE